MVYNQKNGFTLIELVMSIAIISILSVSGAYFLVNLTGNSIALPNQLNMDMLVSDAFDIIVEGDSQAKGLRYCKQITRIRRRRVDFINQDDQAIVYRFRNAQNRFTRSVDGNAEETFPYYLPSGITLEAPGNTFFTYYDENEAVTANLPDIRRIEMTITAKTGSGSLDDWEGQSTQSTSVLVQKFL